MSKNIRSTLTTADPDTTAIANHGAIAGTIVQLRNSDESLIALAVAAQSAGAAGIMIVSNDENPDAVPSADYDDSVTPDQGANVVKFCLPKLDSLSINELIDSETGQLTDTLSDEAQQAGLQAGSVLVGIACPKLGTPMQYGHDVKKMVQGCLGDDQADFKRNLITSGLIASEKDYESKGEEIFKTLEFELRFRPAITIPVVMVSGNVGAQTLELGTETPVVFAGPDGSGSTPSRIKIEQVNEEEGDYHHLFFQAMPEGGWMRWTVELGEEGKPGSWRGSYIGIATQTGQLDEAPRSRAGLSLYIGTSGLVAELKDGNSKRASASGRTAPGQALIFELDLSGDGEFSVYRGVKDADSLWTPGELVHKFTGCCDAKLRDYAWHPCVARVGCSFRALALTSAPVVAQVCVSRLHRRVCGR